MQHFLNLPHFLILLFRSSGNKVAETLKTDERLKTMTKIGYFLHARKGKK